MKKSRLLGAVCACYISILPSTVSATAVWAGNVWDGFAIWTMYLVTLESEPQASLTLTGIYFDETVFGAIDPIDLLNNTPEQLYNSGGDSYDAVTYELPPFTVITTNPIDTDSFALISTPGIVIHQPDFGLNELIDCDDIFCEVLTTGGVAHPWGHIADRFEYFDVSEGFVRVASSVVPIPPALWLFGSGLLGLVGISRRKKVA